MNCDLCFCVNNVSVRGRAICCSRARHLRYIAKKANALFDSGERLVLTGGGIEATIILRTMNTFILTGPVLGES